MFANSAIILFGALRDKLFIENKEKTDPSWQSDETILNPHRVHKPKCWFCYDATQITCITKRYEKITGQASR